MKDKKCEIIIEFQAEREDDLKFAAKFLDHAISQITWRADVSATIKMPEKYSPYIKS